MPLDPAQASDFIRTVGFPAAVAVAAIVIGVAALWFQRRDHQAELERLTKEHERQLRDKDAGAQAWKQMYELANEERKANGREVAAQLRTLDIALELVQRQGRK